jgi:hypothetical protein
MRIAVPMNHPKAGVLAEVTFPTKRETAEDHPWYFAIIANGIEQSWRVFNPDVPVYLQDAIARKFAGI